MRPGGPHRAKALFCLVAWIALGGLVIYGLVSREMYGPTVSGIGPQAVSRGEDAVLYWMHMAGTSTVAAIFFGQWRRHSAQTQEDRDEGT